MSLQLSPVFDTPKKAPQPSQFDPLLLGRDLEPLLSIDEAARVLAVSPATIRTWIHRRRLSYVKMGRRVGFHPDAIRHFIAKNTRMAAV